MMLRVIILLIIVGLAGPLAAQENTLEKSESKGDVTVSLIANPSDVHLDRKTLLTVRVTAPEYIQTIVPPINDRLTGFTLSGEFSNPDMVSDGIRTREFHYRLTPQLAEEYRVAPMAISWVDTRSAEGKSEWLATPPLVLERAPLLAEDADLSLADVSDAVWLRPSAKTILLTCLMIIVPLVVLFLIIRAIIRARTQRKERGLTPAQQALKELNELISKALPESGQVREFYFELTMIVRRYIENAHRIRAPEQTTEEFLRSATESQVFTTETLDRLRAFMRASDLVKYAAQEPDQPAIENALHTARTYIETDHRISGPQGIAAEPPIDEDHGLEAQISKRPTDIQLEEVFRDLLKDPIARGRIQMLLHSEHFRRQQFIDDTIGEWKYMGFPDGILDALRLLADENAAPNIERIFYDIDPGLKPSKEEHHNV